MAVRLLTHSIVGTSFQFFSDDEIRRLSVKQVTNPQTFDTFGKPVAGGVYDRALGPTEFSVTCPTCGLGFQECPGHLGHIELCSPVYNPTLFTDTLKLLKLKCYACHRLRAPAAKARILRAQLMLLDLGRLTEAIELETTLRSAGDRRAAEAVIARLGASEAPKGKKGKAAATGAPEDAADALFGGGDDGRESEEARVEAVLSALEVDCLTAGGPDVGCGLSALGGAGRYSAHVRRVREGLISDFLGSGAPPKHCANCGALALRVRKDGWSKLFQTGLSAAEAAKMRAKGVRYIAATELVAVIHQREQAALGSAAGEGAGDGPSTDGGDRAGSIRGERRAAEAAAAAADASEASMHDDGVGFSKEVGARNGRGVSRRALAAASVSAVLADLALEGVQEMGLFAAPPGDEDEEEGLDEEGEEEEGGGARAKRRRAAAAGTSSARPSRFMPTPEAAAHLELLWRREGETMRRLFLPTVRGATAAQQSASRLPRASGLLLRNGVRGAGPASSAPVTEGEKYAGWRGFFLRVLPVPPPRFRPPARMGEMTMEHPQNVYLTRIIRLNDTLVDLGLGKTRGGASGPDAVKEEGGGMGVPSFDLASAIRAMMDLQKAVNGLLDAGKLEGKDKKNGPPGIRQLLERKAGLFRMHMMGKRVNYAARSVISPDPFLNTDQVGVPLRFAKTLSYKVGVTPFNVALLRQLVVSGPRSWPGATHVEDESGVITDLSTLSKAKREKIAKELMTPGAGAAGGVAVLSAAGGSGAAAPSPLGKGASSLGSASAAGGARVGGGSGGGSGVDLDPGTAGAAMAAGGRGSGGVGIKRVWRHLLDDDIVLMNRQPTLHKPSIMAQRVRVMRYWNKQQTIRFHYANCKTFNADFDGDEMNLHLPQDDIARSEAYNIVAAPYQYLAPTSGQPLRGLIQDHNSIAVLLTKRDTLLTRDQYAQLVFSALQALPAFGAGMGSPGGDGAHGAGALAPGQRPGTSRVPLLPPAILKPTPLWSGKQVVSSVLMALTGTRPGAPSASSGLWMDGKTKIGDGLWGAARGAKDSMPLPGLGESALIIRGSQLLVGVIDKNSLGNTSGGLTHCVYEAYGPPAAGALLSSTGRLLTVYLQWASSTCGMDDLQLTPTADAARAGLIQGGRDSGALAGAAYVLGSPAAAAALLAAQPAGAGEASARASTSAGWRSSMRLAGRAKLRGGAAAGDTTGAAAVAIATELDNAVKGAMADSHSKIIDACLPHGLAKPFPSNQFSLMVVSGAKGSSINHAMIAVGLGQQELEGRRVPLMPSGKSLPCFPAFDPAPRAGGYIADRFLTGLRPQEYFMHCMSGREGLVDTAVKTSRSGYLQRCLVKHLETLRVHYDGTVRDADGGLVQTSYGEDGLDPLAAPFLATSGGVDGNLSFLARNAPSVTEGLGFKQPAFAATIRSLHAEATVAAAGAVAAARALTAACEVPGGGRVSLPLSVPAYRGVGALPAAAMPALATWAAGLAAGASVQLRVPSDWGRGLKAGAGAITSWPPPLSFLGPKAGTPSLSLDGRKAFEGGAPAVTGRWHAATLVKVRRGDSDDESASSSESSPEAVTLDLSLTLAVPVPMEGAPVVVAGADDEAIEPIGGGGAYPAGVRYATVRVTLRKVPLLQPSSGVLLVRPPGRLPDPVMSHLSPASHLGSLGESLYGRVADYMGRNPSGALKGASQGKGASASNSGVSPSNFQLMMYVKGQRALAAPGEPVGVLAAQGVGEPSTQMTLNTFHLAGGGGVNVTLGIPRLREIIMTASANIKTPAMSLPLTHAAAPSLAAGSAAAAALARLLSPLPLLDLVDVSRPDGGITVTETLRPLSASGLTGASALASALAGDDGSGQWVREYAVRLHVAPLAAVAASFGLAFRDVASVVASGFTPRLLKLITDEARKAARAAGGGGSAVSAAAASAGMATVKSESRARAKGDDEEEEGEDAKPAGGSRKRRAVKADAPLDAEDADDEDGDEEDEEAEEGARGADGTLRTRLRKEVEGYDEDDSEGEGKDAESESDEDAGFARKKKGGKKAAAAKKKAGKKAASSSSGEAIPKGRRRVAKAAVSSDSESSDSDSEDVAQGASSDSDKNGGDAASVASSSSSSSGSSSSDSDSSSSSSDSDSDPAPARKGRKGAAAAPVASKKRLTSKALQRAYGSAAANDALAATAGGDSEGGGAPGTAWVHWPSRTFRVDVPEAVLRHPRFAGVVACETGAWPDDPQSSASEDPTSPPAPWVQLTLAFPASSRKVLMLASAERAAGATLVRSVKGISRALATTGRMASPVDGAPEERTTVVTEGVNLAAAWELASTSTAPGGSGPLIDVNRLGTNDVAAVLRTYGVEGARAALVRELKAVFDAYGIALDTRHLFLIADYMTYGGGYTPMNRLGIGAHSSPYLRMSFETTTKFLTQALLSGEHEAMTSPSARLVMGRVVDGGTGCFDLWTPLQTHAAQPLGTLHA